MKTIASFCASMLMLFSVVASAGNNPSAFTATQLLNPKSWSFEENLGQLKDPSGNALPEIKYFGKNAGVQVYCMPGKLSFVFSQTTRSVAKPKSKVLSLSKIAIPAPTAIKYISMDMEFEGANPNVKILATENQGINRNYLTSNNHITGVSSFKNLTYIGLYPNIDMVLIAKDQGMEYQFIVHPGGKVSDIKIARTGMDKMEMLDNGGIRYTSSLGTLNEASPVSYTSEKGIKSNFINKGNNTISFNTENYDNQKDLIIDPDLTWATYFGGENEDIGYGLTIDPSGNIYIAGVTLSTTGIASSGAYQSALGGTHGRQDVFVAKYNSTGMLQWATYYGGDSTEFCTGITRDGNGNLFVTGYTQSTSGIATSGAYQTKLGGSIGAYDAFLAKFSDAGALIWGTYFGGELDESASCVAVDASNNVIIGGYGDGSATGVATSGAHQTSFGGVWDVMIAKFTNAGALIWSTYYGGRGDDKALGLATDIANNIYISGYTRSANAIITSGAYSTVVDTANGTPFLSKFDNNGVLKWGTYYGDTAGGTTYGVATKGTNDIYIAGTTASTTGIATVGAYQELNMGYQNAYLADFSAAGALKWGTYYGGEAAELAIAVAVDTVAGNIYLTGGAQSTTGVATSGAYQTTLDTMTAFDAFMAKFSSAGDLKYGTYYGGLGVDEGIGIALDNTGSIYIVGGSTSTSGVATSGAQQSLFGGGDFDAFLAKFDLCNINTSARGKMAVCVKGEAFYKAVDHGNAFLWTVTGGKIIAGSGTDSITVQWPNTGAGTVQVREVAITGCRDSVFIPVIVYGPPTPSISGNNSLCPPSFEHYSIKSDSGASYLWTINGGNTNGSLTADTVTIDWLISGKGKVLVKETNAGGCVNSDSITVNVLQLQNAKWKVVDDGNGVYTFKCDDSTNATFGQWLIQGNSITGYHTNYTFTHNGTYPISFSIDNANCESHSDSSLIINDAGISQQNMAMLGLKVSPNPFTNTTSIQYTLPNAANVLITVTDMLGRNIAILEDKTMAAGQQETLFTDNINNLEPGTYFIKIQVGNDIMVQKVIRMKE